MIQKSEVEKKVFYDMAYKVLESDKQWIILEIARLKNLEQQCHKQGIDHGATVGMLYNNLKEDERRKK